jgi:branched-chain amino acid transport system permease protein
MNLPLETIVQSAASGLLMGAAYALIAVGFSIVFGVMNIVNFAHGHLVMAAMFAAYALNRWAGVDPYVAGLLVLPAFLVLGALLYKVVVSPILHASQAAHLLSTLGLLIVIENLANLLFGADMRSVSLPYAGRSFHVVGIALPLGKLIAALGSLAAIGGVWAVLRFTRFGAEIRAAADNALGALLVGVSIRRVFLRAFALATGTAAVAGILLLPFYLVNPFVGHDFMLKAFVIAILGGLGSLPGALVAGLLVGMLEAAGGLFVTASLGNTLVFALLMVVLLVRPWGLFGRPS